MTNPFFFGMSTVFCLLVLFSTVEVSAQWTPTGNVSGIKIHRDERTGLEWTETIGQVQSSGWGAPARALVGRYGFRLPSFRELQIMEMHGGFRRLRINTSMQQYYETSNSNVLGAAWGNGFKTPQQRKGSGRNWVIGVRSTPQQIEEVVSVSTETMTGTAKKTKTTQASGASTAKKPKTPPITKPDIPEPDGLPVLPSYDD